jgi:hypothetical protein
MHQGAVCFAAASGNELTMIYKKVIPLVREESLNMPAE